MNEAYNEGVKAYKAGLLAHENPYEFGGSEFTYWHDGYYDAFANERMFSL